MFPDPSFEFENNYKDQGQLYSTKNYVPIQKISTKLPDFAEQKMPDIFSIFPRDSLVNIPKSVLKPKQGVKIPDVVIKGGPIEIKDDHVEKQFETNK